MSKLLLQLTLVLGCTPAPADGDTDGEMGPVVGGACAAEEEGTLRCGPDNAALLCDGGAYQEAFRCPEQQACQSIETFDQVRCGGVNYGIAGRACNIEDDQICTAAADIVLRCRAGTWAEAIHCDPSHCTEVPESDGQACFGSWCANCGYSEGDMCAFAPGLSSCSTDLRSIVQCSDGVVTVERECNQDQTCVLFGDGTVDCG